MADVTLMRAQKDEVNMTCYPLGVESVHSGANI